MFIRLRTVSFVWAAVFLCSVSQNVVAADAPNLRGSYLGTFQPQGTSNLITTILPYIEQDNVLRINGQFVTQRSTTEIFPFRGIISPTGICTVVSTIPTKPLVLRSTWEKFSNGAGGLFGTANLPFASGKTDGAIFLFRPMALGNTPRPNVKGTYSGNYTTRNSPAAGSVITQITDGTSNTFTVNLTFVQGQQSLGFACVGDAAPDGTFAGMGISPDGRFAIIRGYIEQDNLRGGLRLTAEVQIKNALGQTTSVNSIIAILIG